jgi:hypothetical protein
MKLTRNILLLTRLSVLGTGAVLVTLPGAFKPKKVEACSQCYDEHLCIGDQASGWQKCTIENNYCYYYTGNKQACG